ncbi:MAG: hypothetical protein ACRD2P_00085 [Terriglobia bacterium]
MQPEHIRFGGGATATVLHPLVAVGMLVVIVLILTLPRNKAITPFLLAYFTIPLGQVLVLGGAHFTMLQILILTVVGRMAVFRGSASEKRFAGGFNALDKVVVLWALSALIIVSLQWLELQAFIKFMGDLIETLGGYLAVRFLIPDRDAVRRTVKVLAVICVIQGVCMMSEQFTLRNVFGFLGAPSTDIRDGNVRAQGTMGALYGGVFAGVLIPLFLWLWAEGKPRLAAYAGFAGATAMVVASHTSTALMAYAGGLLGLGFWPLRKQMRLVRWAIVATLLGLQLVMNGPVWSLIEKVDLIGGSSSYHRYMLIDTLIRHFGEWWLLGTRNNGSWGWESWDTCNQFVAIAVTGGLLTLALWITILKRGFAAVGNARKQVSGDRREEWFLWCLASSLFANVVAQFGINYMAQLLLVLYPLLACISVVAIATRQVSSRSAEMLDGVELAPITSPAEA